MRQRLFIAVFGLLIGLCVVVFEKIWQDDVDPLPFSEKKESVTKIFSIPSTEDVLVFIITLKDTGLSLEHSLGVLNGNYLAKKVSPISGSEIYGIVDRPNVFGERLPKIGFNSGIFSFKDVKIVPTTEIVDLSFPYIFNAWSYRPPAGHWLLININFYSADNFISVDNRLGLHHRQLIAHNGKLAFDGKVLKYSDDDDDAGQNGNRDGGMDQSPTKFVLGCFLLFCGAALTKLFFQILDSPFVPSVPCVMVGAIGIAAFCGIAEGTILVLAGHWRPLHVG